jgi:ABC-type sugar transport system permease subunit
MNKIARFKLTLTLLAVVLVAGLAWGLRWRAATMLPVDFDEDDYLRASQQYTALIRANDWGGFTQTNYRSEHPPLSKILFGISLLQTPASPLIPDRPTSAQPDQTLPRDQVRAARTLSAFLGTLTAGLLALVNPLAGLLLAVHGMTIKYDSQIMLEALPALSSLAMVLAYLQSNKHPTKPGWLMLSAILLGLTAASKYLYCVAGLAIVADWLLDLLSGEKHRVSSRAMLAWGLVGMAVFVAADPYLWPDPLVRLKESVLFHAGYAAGAAEVKRYNFPIWQPLIWLNTSPYSWQPGQVFLFGIDGLISLFALFGLGKLWKNARVHVLWLGLGLFFLLIWPTKWPQYILLLTAPLCLAASQGVMIAMVDPVQTWWQNRKNPRPGTENGPRGQLRAALPWLIPGLLAFTIFTILPLLFQLGVSLTDFNNISIRDGLNGGILREVWGGLTGQIPAASIQYPYRLKEVHFVGPGSYLPTLNTITSNGLLVFNLMWTVLSVALQTALGLGLALLLWQRGLKIRRGWEMLFIIPWAIPEMIGAEMWRNVFASTTGWLSLAVQAYGPNIPFAFLLGWERQPASQLAVLLIAAVWYGFPFMLLASSAGLKMLPDEVFDAAQLDGASTWQTFRYVTWPLIRPLLLPAIIIRGIFAFNQFYLFQAFRVGNLSLATYSYNVFNPSGFQGARGQYATSAVINIISLLIMVIFVILFNRGSKAGEGVTYA